jgi:hypothetical protein
MKQDKNGYIEPFLFYTNKNSRFCSMLPRLELEVLNKIATVERERELENNKGIYRIHRF